MSNRVFILIYSFTSLTFRVNLRFYCFIIKLGNSDFLCSLFLMVLVDHLCSLLSFMVYSLYATYFGGVKS